MPETTEEINELEFCCFLDKAASTKPSLARPITHSETEEILLLLDEIEEIQEEVKIEQSLD